ncbi:alpha/beta fold hydrolase [Rhizobium sp. NZLR1b]|uniref:alpha/beta hydrolase n=1 Tax=Rhizobium sp. NZLR1b TaxID=2731099 RepID=UPI001C833BB3|nr:alpha/beta fold hydrolase [Rhizobium sp. NZLR1b]MBX5172350.1 alpha/beta fold hydrolase [Rhizobium sp. NZLR1b]
MAAEATVNFEVGGDHVVGTLRLTASANAPTVVLLHGFGGTRHELMISQTGTGIFTHTAEKLASLGFSSLRIDFRGVGESGGRFQDTTYNRQIEDCIAAMDFVSDLPSGGPNAIFLLGWSQGGLVAAVAAGRTNRPAAVALWAPVGEPKLSFPALIGRDVYERALENRSPTKLQLPWGSSITLGHDFFADVESLDPLDEIAKYDGPVFLAEGSLDTAIPVGTAAKFARAHKGAHQVWEAPMDHIFNTCKNVDMLDRLITATARFFGDRPDDR